MSDFLDIVIIAALFGAFAFTIQLFANRHINRVKAHLDAQDWVTFETMPHQIRPFETAAKVVGWRMTGTVPGDEGSTRYTFEKMDARAGGLAKFLDVAKRIPSPSSTIDDRDVFPIKIKATGTRKPDAPAH